MANVGRSSSLQSFCDRLKRLQQSSGISQKQLAQAVNYGPSQISDVLNGKIRQPPSWRFARSLIETCLSQAERTGSAVPSNLQNFAIWERLHHDLENDFSIPEPAISQPRRSFAQWLRQQRLTMGVTQKELAVRIGKSGEIIGRWERGDSVPVAENVELLAGALLLTGSHLADFKMMADEARSSLAYEPDHGDAQEDNESSLLLRVYIPSERLYAAEADRVLSLFRDWIIKTRGGGVRQSGYRTAAGQMYEFFADGSVDKEDLRQEIDNFSNFLTLCSVDPSLAAEQLAPMGFGRAASADFVTRFGREVRRLQIDLAHERERRVLGIRHDLEEELVDAGVELGAVPSAQINSLIERLVPGSSASDSLALIALPQSASSTQTISTLALNINQQYINAVESTVIQNVQGVIHLSAYAKEFLALIDRFGGDDAPSLSAAIHELEDPDARSADRSVARRRLKTFLGQVAGVAHDVGLDLLQKYLESKMGL